MEVALATLWQGWGIRPAALVGHSYGGMVITGIADRAADPDESVGGGEDDRRGEHDLPCRDVADGDVLEVIRPAKVVKSRLSVRTGDRRRVGEIVQDNVFGKIRFTLTDADGRSVGQVRAENWRAWDFAIVNRDGREVARIDKRFVGVLKAVFTTADTYVVHIDPTLDGDLRLLVIAAAAAVDTALKQDERRLDISDVTDIFGLG